MEDGMNERVWEIARVLSDAHDVTLDEALAMRREAEALGVPCDVTQSPTWGGWTLTPRT